MMDDNAAMIGDYLGTIEEYVPGDGTFAEDGKIFAASVGKSNLDKDKREVSVSTKNLGKPAVGQIVYGDVMGFRKNVVTIIVSKIKDFKGDVDFKSEIYVSNISDKYVEKPESLFGIGDIVEAEIVKIEGNTIDLSTKGDFGVVKAFCKVCRRPLVLSEKQEGTCDCDSCGNNEQRKIGKNFNKVVL
ncbi:MAG: exosome complex RNA-binding protein Csl4 [Methanobacteriota archaeon]